MHFFCAADNVHCDETRFVFINYCGFLFILNIDFYEQLSQSNYTIFMPQTNGAFNFPEMIKNKILVLSVFTHSPNRPNTTKALVMTGFMVHMRCDVTLNRFDRIAVPNFLCGSEKKETTTNMKLWNTLHRFITIITVYNMVCGKWKGSKHLTNIKENEMETVI